MLEKLYTKKSQFYCEEREKKKGKENKQMKKGKGRMKYFGWVGKDSLVTIFDW